LAESWNPLIKSKMMTSAIIIYRNVIRQILLSKQVPKSK
jgi:hypothetical protein